ncbi:MAG: hypothetical protein LBH42_10220 [Treponema sp.]|jgi:hypothetical protein|nr:hypothetical protein [Treponema sp.]
MDSKLVSRQKNAVYLLFIIVDKLTDITLGLRYAVNINGDVFDQVAQFATYDEPEADRICFPVPGVIW